MRSNAVIDFLKTHGVADKDIKTTGYGINPQYQYSNRPCSQYSCPPQGPPSIASYEVRHTLEIKIHDLAKADVLLDGIIAAGANEVGQISFRVDDPEVAGAEARTQAIADARMKAEKIARDLGVRLVRVSSFFEQQDGSIPPMPYEGMGAAPMVMKAAVGPAVQPGEQEIKSSVTVTYEFR